MFSIHKFRTLKSTNDKAKKYPVNSIIIADSQSKGRGRFKRSWVSRTGGIYISFVILPKNDNLGITTFLASVAVNKTLLKECSLETEIKWPNDILWNGKKLCGILSECVIKGTNKKMIIGIGLNVNNDIPQKVEAISLKKIFNRDLNRERLISALIYEFERIYREFYLKNRFDEIIGEWKSKCGTINREIRVRDMNKEFVCKAVGIDEECHLIVIDKKGALKIIIEGDILHL